MKALWRVFGYVWPQWPNVIVVVLSAIVVSSLLSLSFMTVIPLLKVMLGEEGLHGWVDRKVNDQRYGITFYVPGKIDFMESDIAHYLLVTGVEDEKPAAEAGLNELDRIVGVGEHRINSSSDKYPSNVLLEELASAQSNEQLPVQVTRVDDQGVRRIEELTLATGERPFYLDTLNDWMSFVPRQQTADSKTKAIIFIILVVGAVTVLRCTAKFFQEYTAQKVVQVAINSLRKDAFVHVLEMPLGYFAFERPSDSVSRIIRDTRVMRKAIKIMLGKALREPLNAMFLLLGAMWINWQLTLIFLTGVPFVFGLLAMFGKKMKRATRKSLVAASRMLAKLQESMGALKVIKIYDRYEHEEAHFSRINNALLKQLLKISKVEAATTPVMEILGMAAGSAALIVGAQWVTGGDMDGVEFLALLVLLGCAAEAARKTSDIWNKVQEANAAADRIFGLLDTEVESTKQGTKTLPTFQDEIVFENVVFKYPGADKPALKGIDLKIKAGQNVAIVGPNGSGKTTLANLLPRFEDPNSGRITIDGVDLREVTLASLRAQIGMVTQNVVTFNDTVAANIGYGKKDATSEEIVAAAKRAFAHEFVEILPNGYDTVIGEHGSGFSGGQLQRIVIARAIVKNPPILIFDEATSQVDADSEAKIHRAIEEIMHGRTSLIIAHRFSTVISADVIVVMDEGKIIAQGQHEQLIKSCKLYHSLYETQLVKG